MTRRRRFAAFVAAAALVAPAAAGAQSVVLNADDAISSLNTINMINRGYELQQQRFQSMMQHPAAFGAPGGPPRRSSAQIRALAEQSQALNRFVPGPSTMPAALAAQVAGDPGKQRRLRASYAAILSEFKTQVAPQRGFRTDLANDALYFFVQTAYLVYNGTHLSSQDVGARLEGALGLYLTAAQMTNGRLANADKQRLYDALVIGAVTLAEAAVRERGPARAEAGKMLTALFGASPTSLPIDELADRLDHATIPVIYRSNGV